MEIHFILGNSWVGCFSRVINKKYEKLVRNKQKYEKYNKNILYIYT